MSRTAKAQQQEAAVQVLSGSEAQVFAAAEAAQNQIAPLRDYLGAEGCQPERLKREALTYIEMSGRAHIEAGIRLKVLRAGMAHGAFKQFVEGDLPCTYEHALRLCSLIDRMLGLHDQSGGKWQLEDLRQLDMKKIFAAHRIAEIAGNELSTSGTIDGMGLDDIALTPRAALEARARELEAETQRLETQIEKGGEQLQKEKDKRGQLQKEFNEYRVASPENVTKACTRLQRNLADSIHEFMRTLPQGQDLNPIQLATVSSTLSFIHTIGDQGAGFLLEHYPAAEYAKTAAETRLTARELSESDGDLSDLPVYDVPGLSDASADSTPAKPPAGRKTTKGNGKAEQ